MDAAAHFAAQLPLLLRGLFYDGWIPSQVPVKYDAEQFLVTVAQEAQISIAGARRTAPEASAALQQRCSPGQLEHMLAQLPGQLRDLLTPTAAPAADETGAQDRTSPPQSPRLQSPRLQSRPARPARSTRGLHAPNATSRRSPTRSGLCCAASRNTCRTSRNHSG